MTTVTPFSKTLALTIFIVFPILGFILGVRHQANATGSMYGNAYAAYPLSPRMVRSSPEFSTVSSLLMWLIPLTIVDTLLKGFALWHAGKNKQMGWFVVLFIVNSMGILPLMYLFFIRPKNVKKVKR